MSNGPKSDPRPETARDPATSTEDLLNAPWVTSGAVRIKTMKPPFDVGRVSHRSADGMVHVCSLSGSKIGWVPVTDLEPYEFPKKPTSTAGETWAKGFRAGEEQAAETLGENGHHEAAKFLRETFNRERALEMPPERPAAGEAFRLVLESIAATSEDQDTRTLASAILNEPGHRTTEQRSVLKELATELGVDRIDAPRRPTATVEPFESIARAVYGSSPQGRPSKEEWVVLLGDLQKAGFVVQRRESDQAKALKKNQHVMVRGIITHAGEEISRVMFARVPGGTKATCVDVGNDDIEPLRETKP